MVSGSTVNSGLEEYNSIINSYQSNINSISDWRGASKDKLSTGAAIFIDEFSRPVYNQFTAFASACDLYNSYLQEKYNLRIATDNYNKAVYNKDTGAMQTFANNITTLNDNIYRMRSDINNLLSAASSPRLSAEKLTLTIYSSMFGSNSMYAYSDKILNPVVQSFLENNRGKTVEVPKEVRKALGLQTDGLISIPDDYDSTKAYPFLLWLVGTGHSNVSTDTLKTACFAKSLVSGKYKNNDALIYIPTHYGNGQEGGSIYYGSRLDNDLDNLINGLNVDMNRISCAGNSIGAFAATYLTQSHPGLFSTVALTGGGYGGSPNPNVKISNAIANNPDTTFIWYVADNDESAREYKNGDYCGRGVHTYTLDQHQQLQAAGINSVYYEVGGGIGHAEAVSRFATQELLYDLTHIYKGQQFSYIPSGIVKVTPRESYDASIDGNNSHNDFYVILADQ